MSITKAVSLHSRSTKNPVFANFLGHAPIWYKWTMIGFLIANFGIYYTLGAFVAGWCILLEFIFTLAGALFAFPLVTGGLLLLQAILLQLVPLKSIHEEIAHNMPILYLILFVVTGVHFLKDLLSFLFIKAILGIKEEIVLAVAFLVVGGIKSGVLDALTVMSVVIAVLVNISMLYQDYASRVGQEDNNPSDDAFQREQRHEVFRALRAALRRLAMQAAVGTMLGGIATLIGEPQNLLIGAVMNWHFSEFFFRMLPVSLPVFTSGVITSFLLEKFRYLDFGQPLPREVRDVLQHEADKLAKERTSRDISKLWVQAIGAVILITALVLHITEVYVAGLMLLIIVAAFNGASEHEVADGIKEGGAFVFVLAVFFGIVAMIHSQHLFAPVSEWVLGFEGKQRLLAYYFATGALSAISDNVFVASLFITDTKTLYDSGAISREEFEKIAVAINMGTNIPSILTPNGQAAFLFLLMSRLAPLIQLTYSRMLLLALPFAIVCTTVGALSIWFFV